MSFVLRNIYNFDDAAKSFGSGVVEGYTQGSDDRAIRRAVDKLPPNASYRDILQAVGAVNTYNPESKQQAVSNWMKSHGLELEERKADIAEKRQQYLDNERIEKDKARQAKEKEKEDKKEAERLEKIAKENQERLEADTIVDQLDIDDKQKAALRGSISKNAAEDLLKTQIKEGGKETPFEKAIQNKNAEEYIRLNNEIPKLEDTLNTINYAREISDKIGYGNQALSALGLSEQGTLIESVTFPLIEPILKMLAPSGAIAKEKLIRSEQKYAIKGSDAPWNRKAKLDALENFTKQAVNRAKQKKALIEQYDGRPPKDVIEKFDRESDTMIDAMIDYDLVGEEATDKELPKPKEFKGKTITAPDGRKFYSDGTRWTKK